MEIMMIDGQMNVTSSIETGLSILTMDRSLLASKLKTFGDIQDNQGKGVLGFMMKTLMETPCQQMKSFSFQNLGEIPFPISVADFQSLKKISTPISPGVWEMSLTEETMDTKNAEVKKLLNDKIPNLVEVALKKMDLCSSEIKGLTVRPDQLILIEAKHNNTTINPTRTPGSFARMVVHFPVDGGHEEGSMKISRGKETRLFKNATDSANALQYTVFMSDCSCQVNKLKSGSTVLFTFDLTCEEPSIHFPLVSLSNEIHAILRKLNRNGSDRLLAIPLDEMETSFSSLSKRTNSLVNLFNSFGFLQLSIALVCRHVAGKARQRSGCECCRQRGCPCQEIVMMGIQQEAITTSKWLDPQDKPMDFLQLNVDTKKEVVTKEESFFFKRPTEEKINTDATVLEQWFYRPALVIWHQSNSILFDCLHRFASLLVRLEIQLKTAKLLAETRRCLKEIIELWRQSGDVAAKTEGHRLRLLKLCLRAGTNELAVDMLELLHRDEGIVSADSVFILMDVVHSVGWDCCFSAIVKLISLERAGIQMSNYVNLAVGLLDRNEFKAAGAISDRIFVLLKEVLTSLDVPVLASCVDMAMRMDEHPPTRRPARLSSLASQIKSEVASFVLFVELLSCIQDKLNARPAERIPHTVAAWYYDVCLHSTGLRIPTDIPPMKLLAAVELYVSSGDASLLDAFVAQLTSTTNQENEILKSLLQSEELWAKVGANVEWKSAVNSLVDKRIQWLTAIPKPQSSWSYLNAVVVGHPSVEQFMRSDQQTMVYNNFNNLQHARNWARKHFSGCRIASAEPGGIGSRAFCIVTKYSKCYSGVNAKNAIHHKELMKLIDFRLKRLGDAPCSIVVDTKTEEIFAVVVQSEGVIDPNTSPPVVAAVPEATVHPPVLQKIENKPVMAASNRSHPASRRTRLINKRAWRENLMNEYSKIPSQLTSPDPKTSVNTAPPPTNLSTPSHLLVPGASPGAQTTPKRPMVAKRPLTGYSCPSQPLCASSNNQVKSEVSVDDRETASGSSSTATRTLIGSPSTLNEFSSPNKRMKLET